MAQQQIPKKVASKLVEILDHMNNMNNMNNMNINNMSNNTSDNNDDNDDLKTNENVLDLEHQISELIRNGRSGCHASFRYSHQGPKVRTKLVTWNPKHRSTFLVHEVEASSRIDTLKDLLIYVKDKIRDQERPYTVKWYFKHSKNTNDLKLVTSHFYATDLYSLLDKFYYDKNKDDYQIVEIKLNPSH